MKLRTASLLAMLTLAISGCCNSKVDECNKLIKVLNDNGETFKPPLAKIPADTVGGMTDLAIAIEKGADAAKSLELKDDALKGFAKEYQEMLTANAKWPREVVDAITAKDLQKFNEAKAAMSKLGPSESALVAKVNAYCK